MKSPNIRPSRPVPCAFLVVVMAALSACWASAQSYSLIDDFESYTVATYNGGSTAFEGNGGPWQSNTGGGTGLVAIDDDGSTQYLAFGWNAGQRGGSRAVTAIPDGLVGTYYFRIRTADGTPNASFGLSYLPSGGAFVYGDFEVQVNLVTDGGSIDFTGRNAADFDTLATGLSADTWYDVWVVVDNAADTYDVYLGTTGDPDVLGTLVGEDLVFRNSDGGAQSSDLVTFMTLSNGHQDLNAHLDDIHHVSGVAPGLEIAAMDDAIEVGIGGAIQFDPRANDTGSIDPASVEVVSAPSAGTAKVDPGSGNLIYKHTGNSAGSDSFSYRVGNSTWSDSDEATVNVTISGALRIDNMTASVPDEAPVAAAGELAVVDGLPGLNFPGAVGMTSIPGSPEQLLVASVNGSVWWVPDSTATTPVAHEILDVSALSNFVNGRSIYSIECFPEQVTGAGNLDIILTYQGDKNRLPVGTIPGLDKNGGVLGSSSITCDLRISRFTFSPAHFAAVTDGLSPGENEAVLNTEFPYLNLAEQHDFHTINDAKFHWDSSDPLRKFYLFVSFGDEGDQGSPYWNSQKITKDQFSSIICIDLNPASTNPKPNPHYAIPVGPLNYFGGSTPGVHDVANTEFTNAGTEDPNFRVPVDNPLVHTSKGGGWNGVFNGTDYTPTGTDQLDEVRDEMWAIGTRNPFKMCVDWGTTTSDLVVIYGDVGKNDREEFTLIRNGGNGGWGYYEGEIVAPGMSEDPGLPVPSPHTLPIYSYGHGLGNSATGGVIYRRPELSDLTGRYICADFGSGRIWSMNYLDGSGRVEHAALRQSGNKVVDLHVDEVTGDIFLLENDTWSGGSARVLRITLQGAGEDYPQALSELGIFADFADSSGALLPNPGVIPYQPNLKFWSDGADKFRWFLMPDGVSTFAYSQDAPWTFPAGTVAVKHFDYDFGGNSVRLETRVIYYDGEDTYGVSYRWNEAGTEATLVPTEGLNVSFDASGFVTTDLGSSVLDWYIPSRSECITCHNSTAGHLLSLNTRQLNQEFAISGQIGNQLTLLSSGGFLSGFPGSPGSLPRHFRPDETSEDLEARLRSYLDVNCAYCHQPGGNVPPGSWDARAHVSLDATGLLYGGPVSEGTANADHDIVRPGQKDYSVLWNRINARGAIGSGTFNGETQMPPLATSVLDTEGIALVEEWIENHANVAPTVPASISVDEGRAIGASVVAALASDPDVRGAVADQDQLSYSISGGNPDSFFALDPVTGEVTVTGWLDYETSGSHGFEVTVSDNFAPNPMTTVAQVTVYVTDLEPEDGDGNGLADVWETFYGLSGGTAASDSDGDGTSDFFELLGGTHPGEAGSVDQGETIGVDSSDPTGAVYSWRYVNGMVLGSHYLLQGSGSLATPAWASLSEGIDYEVVSDVADGPGYRRISIRLLTGTGRHFIRLASP